MLREKHGWIVIPPLLSGEGAGGEVFMFFY
jgi:hypothetical protein